MNQATQEALAILVRQAIIAGGTALGINGYLTPFLGELTNLVLSVLIVLGGVLWSQLAQLFKRGKLMQALEQANTTEKMIDSMVRSAAIPTPSVMTPTNRVPLALPRG